MNQCTWLGLPWIPGLAVCLSITRTHVSVALKSGDVSFLEISSEILYCWGAASSCSCEAAKLSNTQRLCWPRPLANLSCRQHRVLADLNQSVKVSAPSSFSPHLFLLRGFFSLSPLPPAFPTWHPASLSHLKAGVFQFSVFQVCFAVLTCPYVHWKKNHRLNSVQSSAKATQHQQSEADASSRCFLEVFPEHEISTHSEGFGTWIWHWVVLGKL